MGEAARDRSDWQRAGERVLDAKYELVHPIGEGGMGTVWRATHVLLGRPVAVKFVSLEGAKDTRLVERFLREARVAAAIHHPHVVDMLDFGTTPDGEPMIVMEFLEGRTLDEQRSVEPLTVEQAVRVMAQVLSALDAVHKAGVVHRDLKPSNVFVGTDGTDLFARLLDFGISYSLDPTSALRRGSLGTDERLIIGTPEYMSPEVAAGRSDVDGRADVYSAGVVLYELLSGVLPFSDELPAVVMAKAITGGAPPLTLLRPDLPELSDVIARTMARDRNERPASAAELRALLLATLSSGATATGRHSIAGRASGELPRAGTTPAGSAPLHIDSERPRIAKASGAMGPPPASGWRIAIGAGLAVAVALVIALAWMALGGSGSPSAERVPLGPPVAPAAPTTSVVATPVVATPVAATPVAAMPVAATAAEAAAPPAAGSSAEREAPAVAPSSAVPTTRRAGERRSTGTAAPASTAPTADRPRTAEERVVRDLDF